MNRQLQTCNESLCTNTQLTHACTCCYPAVSICEDCTMTHLAQPKMHTFISLDSAKDLIQDRNLQKHCLENFSKSNLISSEIHDYVTKISEFKLKILQFQAEITSMIESECSEKITYLNHIQKDAEIQLENIKQGMADVSSYGERLANNYEINGMRGIISSYAYKLEIHRSSIQNAVKSMIMIGNHQNHSNFPQEDITKLPKQSTLRPKSSYTIFIAKNSTRHLVKYDAYLNKSEVTDLSGFIQDSFSGSATHILPDSSVMIVGGCKDHGTHYLGDTYRYDTKSGICAKLANLSYPRCSVHLFFHSECLYAFGGYSGIKSIHAEMMVLNKNRWVKLPEMNYGRCLFGSYYKDSKLYLFGGDDAKTVEFYDFNQNRFYIARTVTVPRGCSLVAEYEDKIYFISHSHLKVMNKEFEVIEEKTGIYHIDLYNLSNSVILQGNIIFYSRNDNKVLAFSTRKKEMQAIMKI